MSRSPFQVICKMQMKGGVSALGIKIFSVKQQALERKHLTADSGSKMSSQTNANQASAFLAAYKNPAQHSVKQ